MKSAPEAPIQKEQFQLFLLIPPALAGGGSVTY